MIDFLLLMLCLGILVSAFLAVYLQDTVSAVVSAGLTSLFASVTYVVLAGSSMKTPMRRNFS